MKRIFLLIFVWCFGILPTHAQPNFIKTPPIIIHKQVKYLTSLNINKSVQRILLKNGFAVDFDVQRLVGKYFSFGAEAGYSHWKKDFTNVQPIDNKGVYFKPFIAFCPLKNWHTKQISPQIQVNMPFIFFKEEGTVIHWHQYYGNTQQTYIRKNQFATGIELVALVNFKVAQRLYIVVGGRYAPYLYHKVPQDNIDIRTAHFAGSGTNLTLKARNQPTVNKYQTVSAFLKIMVGF